MQPPSQRTVPHHLSPVFYGQTPVVYHPVPPFYPQVHPCPPIYPPSSWFGPSQPPYESLPHSNVNPLSPCVTPARQPKQTLFKVDDYWKGKVSGPLPGFPSQSHFSPVTLFADWDSSSKSNSPTNVDARPKPQLLPPLSHSKPSSPSVITEFRPVAKPPELTFPSLIHHSATQCTPTLDVYADIYTPQWIQDIQKLPHRLQPLPPPPSFPSPSYLATFLPAPLLSVLLKLPDNHILATPPHSLTVPPPSLTISSYSSHFAPLLSWELDALSNTKQHTIFWNQSIMVHDRDRAEFVLEVQSLKENVPRIEVGDSVFLREVWVEGKRGTGNAFEGRALRLLKREGLIHFYCPSLKEYLTSTDLSITRLSFNVSFLLCSRSFFHMHLAVTSITSVSYDVNKESPPSPPNSPTKSPQQGHTYTEEMRRWLFPEPEDGNESLVAWNGMSINKSDWVDAGLNEEQRGAVAHSALYDFRVPYLISGPPGTGKTRTMVESVLQILRTQPESCILLCAPSNPATDTLVDRLSPHLTPHEMFRLSDQSRTFKEVPMGLMQYCHIENESFSFPPWEVLMKFRVVACSCLDASILVDAQCTNTSLSFLEERIVSVLHPHRQNEIRPHWTHLLIDEAAQGSEPEILIPISVVSNRHEKCASSKSAQLVLCGDPNQLGPIITSQAARTAELDVSLLERLFNRPLYAEHPFARSKMHDRTSKIPSIRPFTNLVKNYRSHPAILMPPSTIFYDDSLEPYAQNGVVSWSRLPNPDLPLIFLGNDTDEQSVDERSSWFNTGEINKIVDVVTSLLKEGENSSPPLQPKDIGVMAPWRAQVWKVREKLRKIRLGGVDVGNVEDYQGREHRIVIISCVRSQPRFLGEDIKKGLGLLFEPKRMNVAITRAKELLVVIGNGGLLQRDPYWKGFLQFTLRHRLYIGPPLTIEPDGAYVSRLESSFVNLFKDFKHSEAADRGAVMVGGLIREVLRE